MFILRLKFRCDKSNNQLNRSTLYVTCFFNQSFQSVETKIQPMNQLKMMRHSFAKIIHFFYSIAMMRFLVQHQSPLIHLAVHYLGQNIARFV